MPDQPCHPDIPTAPGADGPHWIVTRAGVRAAFGGLRDDIGADAAVSRLRHCLPGIEATIAAEYRERNRVIRRALEDGLRQFVVFYPDRPPLRPAHERLPAGAGCRVLYVLDDREAAVRSWLVSSCRGNSDVAWLPDYPDIERCLRAADVAGDITPSEPVCVLIGAAIQHTRTPETMLSGLWNVISAGSWVWVSQVSPPRTAASGPRRLPVEAEFEMCTQSPLVLRTAAELERLFVDPCEWDFLHFGGIETQTPSGDGPSPSTVQPVPEMLTLLARRPARTRRSSSDGVSAVQEDRSTVPSSPGPYSLTPPGTVPDQAAEVDHPTVGRLSAYLLDKPGEPGTGDQPHEPPTDMGVFVADRHLADAIDAEVPGYRWCLRAQRHFLHRVVNFAARDRGIRQFVILRASLPAGLGATTPHTAVKAVVDAPTTVLVARETVTWAYLNLALAKAGRARGERAAAIMAGIHDVHRPLHMTHKPGNWSLDLTEPVCVTVVGDPSHWPGDVAALIRAYRDEIADGSVIGVSALGPAPAGTAEAAALDALSRHLGKTTEPHLTLRSDAEILGWFDGWTLEPPGVAPVSHWAGPPPENLPGPELPVWCAIATKAAS